MNISTTLNLDQVCQFHLSFFWKFRISLVIDYMKNSQARQKSGESLKIKSSSYAETVLIFSSKKSRENLPRNYSEFSEAKEDVNLSNSSSGEEAKIVNSGQEIYKETISSSSSE